MSTSFFCLRAAARITLALACLSALAVPQASAQISFYTAIDLALRNSHEVRMATADVARAMAGVSQAKDAYVPSLSVGSSLGYSYGFPVGQPSIYNVTMNSLLLSFSQPDIIRSTRASLAAAQAALHDTREKVVAEAALSYTELDADQQELAALDQQHSFGERLVEIERERNTAGLSSVMDVTSAELVNAQLELRRLHLMGHISLLRLRLGNLTGLSEDGVTTESASIPAAPRLPPDSGLGTLLDTRSGALASAEAEAKSRRYLASGDRQVEWRPLIAFGVQYSRYSKFNNYELYYLRFQHNNFDVGINMTLPLYDSSARAKARGSAAEAVRAEEQAKLTRLQLSEQTRELSGSLAELRAQQRIARLQDDYAQENIDVVMTQLQQGTGNPNVTPPTPRDEQKARIEERRRFVDKLEADFQLMQAQIQLQRSLGTLEDWAVSASRP